MPPANSPTGWTARSRSWAWGWSWSTPWAVWAVAVSSALVFGAIVGAVSLAGAGCLAVLVAAGLVDARDRRIPDRLLLLASGVLMIGLLVEADGGARPDGGGVVLAVALFAGPLLALHLVSPRSMGFGDVKAALVLGAVVGLADWRLALPALAIAAAISSVGGLLARARTVPFGPGLVTGTVIALLTASSMIPSESATPGWSPASGSTQERA